MCPYNFLRSQLQHDLMQKWDIPESQRPKDDFLDDSDDENIEEEEDEEIDNGELTLSIALQVIDRFGGKQSNPNLPMDDMMKMVFRDAIDYIGRFISERGFQGESMFSKQDGYQILFTPMNKTLITDFKVIFFLILTHILQIMDAWVTTITSIALAKIESKMVFVMLSISCSISIDSF